MENLIISTDISGFFKDAGFRDFYSPDGATVDNSLQPPKSIDQIWTKMVETMMHDADPTESHTCDSRYAKQFQQLLADNAARKFGCQLDLDNAFENKTNEPHLPYPLFGFSSYLPHLDDIVKIDVILDCLYTIEYWKTWLDSAESTSKNSLHNPFATWDDIQIQCLNEKTNDCTPYWNKYAFDFIAGRPRFPFCISMYAIDESTLEELCKKHAPTNGKQLKMKYLKTPRFCAHMIAPFLYYAEKNPFLLLYNAGLENYISPCNENPTPTFCVQPSSYSLKKIVQFFPTEMLETNIRDTKSLFDFYLMERSFAPLFCHWLESRLYAPKNGNGKINADLVFSVMRTLKFLRAYPRSSFIESTRKMSEPISPKWFVKACAIEPKDSLQDTLNSKRTQLKVRQEERNIQPLAEEELRMREKINILQPLLDVPFFGEKSQYFVNGNSSIIGNPLNTAQTEYVVFPLSNNEIWHNCFKGAFPFAFGRQDLISSVIDNVSEAYNNSHLPIETIYETWYEYVTFDLAAVYNNICNKFLLSLLKNFYLVENGKDIYILDALESLLRELHRYVLTDENCNRLYKEYCSLKNMLPADNSQEDKNYRRIQERLINPNA